MNHRTPANHRTVLARQVGGGNGRKKSKRSGALHFGLKCDTAAVDLEIFWSHGQVQRICNAVHVDQAVDHQAVSTAGTSIPAGPPSTDTR